MYIYRRGDTWWFRKAVPVDLIETLGMADVRLSLRITSKSEARRQALRMAIRVQDVYDVLRAKAPQRASREIALSILRDAVGRVNGTDSSIAIQQSRLQRAGLLVNAMATPAVNRQPSGDLMFSPFEAVDEQTAIHLMRREKPRRAANTRAVELVETAAAVAHSRSDNKQAALLKLESLLQDPAWPTGEMTADAAWQGVQNELRQLRGIMDDLSSRPPPLDKAGMFRTLTDYERSRWSDQKLENAIEQYTADGNITGDGKTQADRRGRLAVFLKVVGNEEVRDIGREQAEKYRDLVDELPDRWAARFENDPNVAIRENKKRREPFATIGRTRADKYLGPVRKFFDWLVAKKAIPQNPFNGVASRLTETTAANAKRHPLNIGQINRLLDLTFEKRKLTAFYWIPRLMLFTGARPNELAQLQVEDLRLDFNDRPHISVLCEEIGIDKKADKFEAAILGDNDGDVPVKRDPTTKSAPDGRRVKTLAGKRLIPVHKELIGLGFVEFWKTRAATAKPGTRIFIDIGKPAKNANFYTALSKRQNRLLRKRCGVHERQEMYSLRHNFNDACKAAEKRREMLAETRMKFMGHRLPGMDGIYGNPLPREDESPTIDSIGYEGLKLQ